MQVSRSGFHAGATIAYNVIKSLSLRSCFSYVKKGFDSSYGSATMDYLQVPVLLEWNFETPTGVLFHLNVGPYFAYGIGGNIHFIPYTIQKAYYFDQDCFGSKGFFKDFDSGIHVGGAIQLLKIRLGIGYEFGLTDIAEVYDKFHNRNLNISLGYNF